MARTWPRAPEVHKAGDVAVDTIVTLITDWDGMPLVVSDYAWEPLALAYFLAAGVVVLTGAGVTLYERFSRASRRLQLLTVVAGGWLVTLGMAIVASDPAAVRWWLRATFTIDPFTAPAFLMLALVLARTHWPWAWLAWLPAVAFSVLSLSTAWLVMGLESFMRAYTWADWGWLGALYFTYIFGLTGLGLIELLRSRVWAVTRDEWLQTSLLALATGISMLTLVDYWLPTETFRAGPVTPLALSVGSLLALVVATRFHAFSIAHSFGSEAVVRALSDPVLVTDSGGRIRSANPAAHDMIGRREGELVGTAVSEYLVEPGGSGSEWVPDLGVVAGDTEMLLIPADGEPIEVSVTTHPLRAQERVIGTVILAHDIRQRLEVRRALEAAERRYTSLFWHNPGMSYEFDRQGRFVAANPATEAVLGMSAEELAGMSFGEIMHPEDLDEAVEIFERVLAGDPQEYELRVIARGGEVSEIVGASIPIKEADEVIGVFGVALDITETARVRRELETQRRYFADLFENSPEALVLVHAETDEVLRINSEFERLFGWTAEEAVGRDLNSLIVPDERAREGTDLNAEARRGRVRAETVRHRKDGTPVEVSLLARSLEIPGEPPQLYGIYRDISDRKATERALRQREEELRHAQKLEAVGKLAGGIAHDFNNLLTVIGGHTAVALENPELDPELEEDLSEIERASQRAAGLIQQLLAFSRRQVLHPQALDPNGVIRDLRRMLGRLIGEHIEVETRLMDEEVRVRADRGQLEQVLVNLVVNARDAMPEGGTLTLASELVELDGGSDRLQSWELAPGRYARLQVCDTGTGMEPAVLDRVFEPFFTTKEQGRGTGLGLATAFGIVKQSGGHMVATNRPEGGARFDVILPITETPSAVTRPTPQAAGAACPPAAILIVEDEGAVRQLVAKVLERQGCTVLAAEDGEQALRLVAESEEPVDLVLSDLVMPGIGGRELADRLREVRPDLPIVFMSGYDEEMIASEKTEEEFRFLGKPFTPAELVRCVSETLEEAEAGP